jgi:hypothetical protein
MSSVEWEHILQPRSVTCDISDDIYVDRISVKWQKRSLLDS